MKRWMEHVDEEMVGCMGGWTDTCVDRYINEVNGKMSRWTDIQTSKLVDVDKHGR